MICRAITALFATHICWSALCNAKRDLKLYHCNHPGCPGFPLKSICLIRLWNAICAGQNKEVVGHTLNISSLCNNKKCSHCTPTRSRSRLPSELTAFPSRRNTNSSRSGGKKLGSSLQIKGFESKRWLSQPLLLSMSLQCTVNTNRQQCSNDDLQWQKVKKRTLLKDIPEYMVNGVSFENIIYQNNSPNCVQAITVKNAFSLEKQNATQIDDFLCAEIFLKRCKSPMTREKQAFLSHLTRYVRRRKRRRLSFCYATSCSRTASS